MLTPTLRLMAQTFPNKGLLPSRTSKFPRRGGFQLSLSRVIVRLFLALVATPKNSFFVRYNVDDGILVEVRWWTEGRRYFLAVQSLASDHFRLLGERGVSDPPLLSARKITDLNTPLEVFGWIIDTEARTVTLPSHKRLKLQNLLAEWPSSLTSASARQVSQLVCFILHVSFAVRPLRFFVNHLLASVGMPRISARA